MEGDTVCGNRSRYAVYSSFIVIGKACDGRLVVLIVNGSVEAMQATNRQTVMSTDGVHVQ